MHGKPKVAGATGMVPLRRADGSWYALWRAPQKAVDDGYLPRSVRIDRDPTDGREHDAIRQECLREQAKVEEWRTAKVQPRATVETLHELSRLYQTHEASPYLAAKHNTQRTYLYELKLIEATIGARRLASIGATDFVRWFKEARDSVDGGGARKAQGVIKRLRALVSFGVMVEVQGCTRLQAILGEMRFETPARRRSAVTYDQAVAIIAKAHELGRPSIALAQAIQFETGLRQTDVIGQWEPCPDTDRSPYRCGGRRWGSGLRWQDVGLDLVLTVETSKTGATATHALGAMPLVLQEIARVPPERRIGAMVINEQTGQPWQANRFSIAWRKVATAAGVPSTVWNRDSRAGAASESDEAGAEIGDIQRMLTHSTPKMTGRYVRGRAVERSKTIAELRQAKRSGGQRAK